MAEMKRQASRVYGQSPKGDPTYSPIFRRMLTPEDRARIEEENKAAYEAWVAERNARIARNAHKVSHGHIIM